MFLLVKLFSIALILYGGLLILQSEVFKKVIAFIKVGNRLYIATAIKTIIGVMMMFASPYYSIPWIVLFIGALMVFSGIAVFVIKKSVVMQFIDWAEKKEKKQIIVIGIVAIAIGALLVLAA